MAAKFTTEDQLVVKVPGSKLPKVINLSSLDSNTQKALIKAYNTSTVYAPNLTATKSEKLTAALSDNIADFYEYLSTTHAPDYRDISSAFCSAFCFDSSCTPNIVRITQLIAKHNYEHVNIDTFVDMLSFFENITVSPAELYAEFQSWRYYPKIKSGVGGVSLVKFMRFYIGLIRTIWFLIQWTVVLWGLPTELFHFLLQFLKFVKKDIDKPLNMF